jgi:hypothetical protein
MVNNAKKFELIDTATRSVQNHYAFADFIKYAELYCGKSNPLVHESDTEKFDAIWFEMEIVNAAALSDWEEAGKPKDWTHSWETLYKKDAVELTSSLTALLK